MNAAQVRLMLILDEAWQILQTPFRNTGMRLGNNERARDQQLCAHSGLALQGGSWRAPDSRLPAQLASRSVSLPLDPKSRVRHTAMSSVVSRSFGWKPRRWYSNS